MLIIPAIDLANGRCVRLTEGRRDSEQVVAGDPIQQARAFQDAGAERIHVVDLDGAFEGRPANLEVIGHIAASVTIPIQVGGGMRTQHAVEATLEAGARWIVLGTMLLKNPDLFSAICRTFPGRVIAGIDAKDGKVATEGWVRTSEVTLADAGAAAEKAGAASVITTDIARDGTGKGVNAESADTLARALDIDVIASGGVAGLGDIEGLLQTEVAGVVVGKALYNGTLNLVEALDVGRSARAHPRDAR